MAILSIESTNPNLSFVIRKNPSTGLTARSIRQGIGYGWFNGETYNLYFQDGVDKDSFSMSEFEYLSQGKFGHPLTFSSLLSTFLRDTFKKVVDEDLNIYQHKITLHQMSFKGVRMLEHLQAHLPAKMEYIPLQDQAYKVEFSSSGTLNHLVSVVMVAMLFLAGEQGVFLTKVNKEFMTKYTGLINTLDLPYFLRYVFARNYLKSKSQFDKFASMLETDNIKLSHGDTAMQRLRYIEKHLDNSLPILDVGHGEGLYALNLSKRNPFTYHAIDIDKELNEAVEAKSKARGLDIKVYNDITEYEHEGQVDVICTEVIEHMPLESAEILVHQLLTTNFRELILTTPNKAFNKHYLLKEDEFRHDDHDWEMDVYQFQDWILNILNVYGLGKYQVEFLDIGDCIEGEYTTQGIKITNTRTNPQVIFTRGISASGKSTWAESVCKQPNWVEINRDNVRFRGKEKDWTKYEFNRKNEERVTKKVDQLIHNAIEQGNNIVISDTNINPVYLNKSIELFKVAGYTVEIKDFDITFEEALKRDTQRFGGVGYEVLLKQYINYQRVVNNVPQYVPPINGTPCYIVDIDGTIADHGNRSPYDLSKVIEDTVISHVAGLVEGAFLNGTKIIFLSGREASCMKDTRKWLSDNLGDWTEDCLLAMREANDRRPDYIVKMELFDKYVRHSKIVLAAIDDRKQVIESCWNVLGVNVINVGNLTERF